jgi:hypothetical protein
MWPWVLGSAALGGLQAYQQSGGDVGKTLTGAAIGGGLGALVPGVGRMAGTALEGTGLLTPLAGNLTKAATAGRQALGLVGPAQAVSAGQLAKLAATGATGLAGMAVPGIAAKLSGAPGQAARAGGNMLSPLVGGAATYGTTYQPDATLPYVPALSQYGESVSKPYGIADVLKGPAAAARLEGYLERQMERAQMIRDAQAQYPILSQAKKDEMDRQLAAYQARRNIDVNADMISSSLHTAQQIGANAASQMGQALAAQYQYG